MVGPLNSHNLEKIFLVLAILWIMGSLWERRILGSLPDRAKQTDIYSPLSRQYKEEQQRLVGAVSG
jgi:hypothetical protein